MQTQAKVTRREIWVDMLMYPRHTLPTAFAPALIAAALAYHNEILHLPTLFSAFMAGWLIQAGRSLAVCHFVIPTTAQAPILPLIICFTFMHRTQTALETSRFTVSTAAIIIKAILARITRRRTL